MFNYRPWFMKQTSYFAAFIFAIMLSLILNLGGSRNLVAQGFQLSGLPNGTGTNPTISGLTVPNGIYFMGNSVHISRHFGGGIATANVPALSSCGTAPALAAGSNDFSGKYTSGSAATTCTLTFGTTYLTNIPSCHVTAEGTATQPTFTTSLTAITVSVDIASTVYNYVCFSQNG